MTKGQLLTKIGEVQEAIDLEVDWYIATINARKNYYKARQNVIKVLERQNVKKTT